MDTEVFPHLHRIKVFKILFVAFHAQLRQPVRDWRVFWVVHFCSHGIREHLVAPTNERALQFPEAPCTEELGRH